MPELAFSLLAILAGAGLLYIGGDMLVAASTFIADRIGMSPVAIGATVVAIGTSAPELSVSLGAALGGHSDVSVGNVVGSNVCNIILVLGLCGMTRTLRPSREIYKIDFPILIVVSAIFTGMIYDGVISRVEGFALVIGLISYVIWNLRRAAEEPEAGVDEVEIPPEEESWFGPLWRAVAGIACLAGGAQLLVNGSLDALEPLHLTEASIGITVVALGTSVPEIGTSLIAAKKGHADLAVGNAIGSSVFNLLGVLGATASIAPLAADDVNLYDGAILIAVSLTGLVLVARTNGIGKLQGILLVGAYLLYLFNAVAFSA